MVGNILKEFPKQADLLLRNPVIHSKEMLHGEGFPSTQLVFAFFLIFIFVFVFVFSFVCDLFNNAVSI
jgi:hypothetical protein